MQTLLVPESLQALVKDIYFFEESVSETYRLPFYADGFPGIIYSRSSQPFYLQPANKKLSAFYLYGQTLKPIALETKGDFLLIALRLYPFAVRILLDVDPVVLNDDCFDLKLVSNINTADFLNRIDQTDDTGNMIALIEDYFRLLLQNASTNPDRRIKLAVNLILKSYGAISIKVLREKLGIGERTFERHFLKETGLTAKQFAKIIQFNSSLRQIIETNYYKLTEVGYERGFADQSHFIRSFKQYTGKTPKEFQKRKSELGF